MNPLDHEPSHFLRSTVLVSMRIGWSLLNAHRPIGEATRAAPTFRGRQRVVLVVDIRSPGSTPPRDLVVAHVEALLAFGAGSTVVVAASTGRSFPRDQGQVRHVLLVSEADARGADQVEDRWRHRPELAEVAGRAWSVLTVHTPAAGEGVMGTHVEAGVQPAVDWWGMLFYDRDGLNAAADEHLQRRLDSGDLLRLSARPPVGAVAGRAYSINTRMHRAASAGGCVPVRS